MEPNGAKRLRRDRSWTGPRATRRRSSWRPWTAGPAASGPRSWRPPAGTAPGLRREVEALLATHERADEGLGRARHPGDEATVAMTGVPRAGPEVEPTRTTAPRGRSHDATATATPRPDPAGETAAQPGNRDCDGLARGAHRPLLRRLRDPGGAGPRRHGRRVQGPAGQLNRPVALKMIKAGLLADDDELRRFQNEAEAVALLDHPGIVPVYEVGEHDGQRYFSMKLIEGGNLAERSPTVQGQPEGGRAARWPRRPRPSTTPTCGASCTATSSRRTSWSTREGHPHVTDFGLAKRDRGRRRADRQRRDPGHARPT